MQSVAGLPQKARASFANGRFVRGTYVPSDQAREITKSPSFTKPSRVLARLSVTAGPETDFMLLRGFSFRLGPTGELSDIITHSAPVHFAKSLDQMQTFLKVRIPGPDGKRDLGEVETFSAKNPETLNQARHIATHPPAVSFARTSYWGVHAFPATNAKGETRFIKFKIVPVGKTVTVPNTKVKAEPADLLHDLTSRIAARDMRFSVMAVLGRPDDPLMDVTVQWPDEDRREAVRLGTVVLTNVESNDDSDDAAFDPATLADGISHPLDEIFAARRAAYTLSKARRR